MALKYQDFGTSGTIGGTLLSTFVVLSITSYVWSYFTRPRRAKIPTYRVSLGGDAAKVLLEAHEEVCVYVSINLKTEIADQTVSQHAVCVVHVWT